MIFVFNNDKFINVIRNEYTTPYIEFNEIMDEVLSENSSIKESSFLYNEEILLSVLEAADKYWTDQFDVDDFKSEFGSDDFYHSYDRKRQLSKLIYRGDGSDLPEHLKELRLHIPVKHLFSTTKVKKKITPEQAAKMDNIEILIEHIVEPHTFKYRGYEHEAAVVKVKFNKNGNWFKIFVTYGEFEFDKNELKKLYKESTYDERKAILDFISLVVYTVLSFINCPRNTYAYQAIYIDRAKMCAANYQYYLYNPNRVKIIGPK